MNGKNFLVATLGVCILFCAANAATAATIFRSEANSADGVVWGVIANFDTKVTFNYDYSADDIPEAPNSDVPGGDVATSGHKAEANLSLPTGAQSLSIFPAGENFTGNYRLRFDAWANFDSDDRHNLGGAGTTEFIGGGVGFNNATTGPGSGAVIIATNEGGSGSDWRILEEGALQPHNAMAAGTRNANSTSTYYSDFLPNVPVPAGQGQIDNTGSVAGSPGFQWITFDITHANGIVSFNIEKPNKDTLHISTSDCNGGDCATEGNLSLFYADLFSSVTQHPAVTFGLFDNIQVETIPEPATAMLMLMGLCAAAAGRVRRS